MKRSLFYFLPALICAACILAGCSKSAPAGPEPSAVAVTGVTLKKTSISIQVDDKETLIATVLPEDATRLMPMAR